jgi:adenine-specific DNA-methyltransferase
VSRLTNLLSELEKSEPRLAEDIRREVSTLSDRRAFGLNFERHTPESVELPGRPIRRGDKVRVLPARGDAPSSVGDELWTVNRVRRSGKTKRIADLVRPGDGDEPERIECDVENLVAVAEFRDPIYPGLVSTGRVERGGGKPFHTVINGENYHALEALLYTHEGSIDAIYIDPPYNTGAKDWKYNNDYVDGEDQYRHSKWLAMMERRLLLAKRLLNPEDSVLIVTIDEKEYLRLGLLLQQVFPGARYQMVSSVISATGSSRSAAFGRTDEYVFFVMNGEAAPRALSLPVEWKIVQDSRAEKLRWSELLRSGSNPRREDRPNQFYPVFVKKSAKGPVFDSVGKSFFGDGWRDVSPPSGCAAVWPIRSDGTEGNWQISANALASAISRGFARLGRWRDGETTISYLGRGEQAKVEGGLFPIVGSRPDGSVIEDASEYSPTFIPGTQWRIPSHNAQQGGTNLLKSFLPDRKFPFPKSLYAVEDTLRFFVSNKPNAKILDFFAGSGTTAHAVARLNRAAGGRRQCILVTNNEVSADEQKDLRAKGLRPGDAEWEALGICEYITKPRIEAAFTGKTPAGDPIKGDYKFTDEFPMAEGFEENVEFFSLTYEAPLTVAHNKAFERVAPLLWLRAGSEGRRIDRIAKAGFDVADVYSVLFNVDFFEEFLDALAAATGQRIAYIVTDDERAFQSICRDLPEGVEGVRLYSSYLTNFEINARTDLA